jgi:hypothetical protein
MTVLCSIHKAADPEFELQSRHEDGLIAEMSAQTVVDSPGNTRRIFAMIGDEDLGHRARERRVQMIPSLFSRSLSKIAASDRGNNNPAADSWS